MADGAAVRALTATDQHIRTGRLTGGASAKLRLNACAMLVYAFTSCLRVQILLREGWMVNQEAGCRLYRLEGLNMHRKRPRRHVSCGASGTEFQVVAAN